ncbi:MAG: hypothetical protein IPG63_07535 [Xanthomonadales bacterium]|nr:hypothetical protein [Xanthomonadales bacterium]MCC6561328.1 hypothetical protein [Xanthomonadales bacterium]
MKIELSRQQVDELLSNVRRCTLAEVDADSEPSGYVLEIHVGSAMEPEAILRVGSAQFPLGPVELTVEA